MTEDRNEGAQNTQQERQGNKDSLGASLSALSDKTKAILVVSLVIAISVGGLLWYFFAPDPADEEPTVDETVEVQEPDDDSQDQTEDSEPEPSPSPSPTYEGMDGPDYDHGEDLDPPGFESRSEREPDDEDEEAGREVLEEVLPAWAEVDTSRGTQIPAWAERFVEMEEVEDAFVNRSRVEFDTLFGGAVQMDVSLENASLVSEEHLWNVGSHSLWRVTIERDLVPNQDGFWEGGSEEVTWDFLIAQDEEGHRLEAFVAEDEDNEDPETFYLPEVSP